MTPGVFLRGMTPHGWDARGYFFSLGVTPGIKYGVSYPKSVIPGKKNLCLVSHPGVKTRYPHSFHDTLIIQKCHRG